MQPHMRVRAKKELQEIERRQIIDRDNRTLVGRIGYIMTHKVNLGAVAMIVPVFIQVAVSGTFRRA